MNQILNSIDSSTTKGLNDKAILSFLFYTGARVSEALDVRVRDLEVQECLPVVHLRGKGGREDYLFTQARIDGTNEPMNLASVHKLIKRRLKKLGLDASRSAHSARRTVIANLLEAGERLELVQKVAGHSSPNVTLRSYNVREEPLAKSPLLNLKYRD